MRNAALIAFGILLIASGCADPNVLAGHTRGGMISPAGFWKGLWHGVCAPFSFFGIMFGMNIGIYESFNAGNWYNLGFLLGFSSLCAGSARAK